MNQQEAAFDYGDLIGRYLEEQYEVERRADPSGFAFEDRPAEYRVTQEVRQRNGKWTVYLIFRDPHRPSTLYRTPVKQCRSRRVAEIVGAYQCRIRAGQKRAGSSPDRFCRN